MTSREAFEAQDRARYDIDATLYSSDHMGRYRDRPIQCRWETWQAAIQHARDVAEDCIEHELGETGQAKAIVFAIKEALK